MTNFDIDDLMLYFGDDYVINDQIRIKQPCLGDLIDYGEAAYFSMVHSISAIPSDLKSQLWDMGIDWCSLDDFDLFCMLVQTLTPDKTGILFGDLDFSKLRPYRNPQNDEVVLADKDSGVVIDKLIYMRMMNYIRKLHNIKPKVEKAKNKRTKEVMIEDDRRNRELNKDKPFKSYLLPLISSIKVKQGYTRDYIRNMGLYEFFDDVNRAQILYNADHLMSAVYAGTIDMKKSSFNKNELNWMRELDK